jgi:LmbE family N-acetylglucosaminyl deacetylase
MQALSCSTRVHCTLFARALACLLLCHAAHAEPVQRLPPPDAATSLLVVAPHPDDEVLCCAGVVQAVLRAGGQVSIIWLTSGDGSRIDSITVGHSLNVRPGEMRNLGATRMQEARHAAAALGVPSGRLYFLGYPDRGLQALLTDNNTAAYRSPFTAATAVPYPDAFAAGHAYTGNSLRADFAAILQRVQPTMILAPSMRDTHPDHSAAGTLTLRLATQHAPHARLLYWVVHGGGGWPTPRGLDRSIDMQPAPRLEGLSLASWSLDGGAMERKLQALREYHTQMQVMSAFMLAFVRRSELFAIRTPRP